MTHRFKILWIFTFVTTFSFALSSFAGTTIEKQARANDIASRYLLESNGNFYRFVGDNKCQITSGVQSFKVSQHPLDAAMVYFERDGDLWILNNSPDLTGPCPKAIKKVICKKVANYGVVSNTETVVVNVALDRDGNFTAWDKVRPVATATQIVDYSMNECFGVKAKSFNSYVAFLLDASNNIIKLKGKDVGASDVEFRGKYYSIDEFKVRSGVCADQGGTPMLMAPESVDSASEKRPSCGAGHGGDLPCAGKRDGDSCTDGMNHWGTCVLDKATGESCDCSGLPEYPGRR